MAQLVDFVLPLAVFSLSDGVFSLRLLTEDYGWLSDATTDEHATNATSDATAPNATADATSNVTHAASHAANGNA